MKKCDIGFIGAGNMAASLIGGLIADGCDPKRLWVSDIDDEKLNAFVQQFGVHTVASNENIADKVSALVLSVKPQAMKVVASGISSAVQAAKPLIISVAAGIRSEDLARWLGSDIAIVRTMPNTPALVSTGATGLFANANTNAEQRALAEAIMRAVGVALWVDDEAQMDVVTALSGSGPAYFFYVIEAMIASAKNMGMNADTAKLLAIQTALGAAKLAMESEDDPAVLRQRVTSPGGTTEQALNTLMEKGLEKIFDEAMQAAAKRAAELAKQYGAD